MADCRNLLLHLTHPVLLVVLVNTSAAQLPQWDWAKGVFRSSSLKLFEVVAESFTDEAVIVGYFHGDMKSTSSDLTETPQLSLKFQHINN